MRNQRKCIVLSKDVVGDYNLVHHSGKELEYERREPNGYWIQSGHGSGFLVPLECVLEEVVYDTIQQTQRRVKPVS